MAATLVPASRQPELLGRRVGAPLSAGEYLTRGKAGSTDHLLVDRQGVPLAVQLSAANVHDSKLFVPLVDAVEPIGRPTGEPGRPRQRPAKLHGDEALV
jgi:Transposase DDE domain